MSHNYWISVSGNVDDMNVVDGAVVVDELYPTQLCVGEGHPVYFATKRTAVMIAEHFMSEGWITEVREQKHY